MDIEVGDKVRVLVSNPMIEAGAMGEVIGFFYTPHERAVRVQFKDKYVVGLWANCLEKIKRSDVYNELINNLYERRL